jgi:chromosome segregation ATPase
MVAITATNSATPSIQASLGKARLEQARNEAAQAESNARDLRAQADAAEQEAQQSQENVRKIASNVQNMAATYDRPRDTSSQEVPAKVQKLIEQMYSATSEKRTLSGNPLKADSSTPAVVNSQGQRTGRIVNISA